MAQRSDAQWIADLKSSGQAQQAALREMGQALERSALFYLNRRLAGSESVASDEIAALAQDVTQEASLLVLQKLDSFRGEARFLTWASSLAVRVAMTALRRRLWRDLSLDRLSDGWQEPAASLVPANGWANPQLATQRHAIWDTINEVVHSELTDRQRQVLDLIVLKGVHTEEVEDRLGVTASALYKMTHDARRKLKAGLMKRGLTTQEILAAFAAEG
jgi:RNA polymerase sigma-70 factor (ECF subfamily)